MIPEIILGMVLMAFFYMMNLPFGMLTLLIGHTVFCVPYILMEVKARLAGMDPSLEEAARDLGAGPFLGILGHHLTADHAGGVVRFPSGVCNVHGRCRHQYLYQRTTSGNFAD